MNEIKEISREMKILLLTGLKRGYFESDEIETLIGMLADEQQPYMLLDDGQKIMI